MSGRPARHHLRIIQKGVAALLLNVLEDLAEGHFALGEGDGLGVGRNGRQRLRAQSQHQRRRLSQPPQPLPGPRLGQHGGKGVRHRKKSEGKVGLAISAAARYSCSAASSIAPTRRLPSACTRRSVENQLTTALRHLRLTLKSLGVVWLVTHLG